MSQARQTAPNGQLFPSPHPFIPTLERPGARMAGGPAVLAGWVVSVAIIIGLSWAAIVWRNNIMHAWPPSERLYSVLGLPAGR